MSVSVRWRFLAFLIASQRHEIAMRHQNELPRAWRVPALRLAMLLRLAVLLNRSRNQATIPPINLRVTEQSLALTFDAVWLEANPLTVADLEREKGFLSTVGYELSFA